MLERISTLKTQLQEPLSSHLELSAATQRAMADQAHADVMAATRASNGIAHNGLLSGLSPMSPALQAELRAEPVLVHALSEQMHSVRVDLCRMNATLSEVLIDEIDIIRGEQHAAQQKLSEQEIELRAARSEIETLKQHHTHVLQMEQQRDTKFGELRDEIETLKQAQAIALHAQQQMGQQMREMEERLIAAGKEREEKAGARHEKRLAELKEEVQLNLQVATESMGSEAARMARADADGMREQVSRLLLVQSDVCGLIKANELALQQEMQRQCDTLGRAILSMADALKLQLPLTTGADLEVLSASQLLRTHGALGIEGLGQVSAPMMRQHAQMMKCASSTFQGGVWGD